MMTPKFKFLKKCLICKSANLKKISPNLKTYVRAIQKPVEVTFHACEFCNFAFQSKQFTLETWKNYYQNNFQLRRTQVTQEESHHMNGQLNFIKTYHAQKKGGKILEVGPDNGSFLSLATDYFQARGFYNEFNAEAIRLLKAQNFKDSETFPNEHFNLVVLRHVFEHISDPLQYLKQLTSMLETDGAIFIEVPDYSYLHSKYVDIFQLEHLNYFSIESLYKIATLAGLSIQGVEFARTPNYSTSPNRVLRVVLKKDESSFALKLNSQRAWGELAKRGLNDCVAIETFIQKNKKRNVAIYGAGTKFVHFLANTKLKLPQLKIYDLDQAKVGTSLMGVPILHPDTIDKSSFDFILITVVGYKGEVIKFLSEKNISKNKIYFLPTEEDES